MKIKLSQSVKHFLLIIIAIFAVSIQTKAEYPVKWQLLTEKSGVQVFYRYEKIDDLANGIHQMMAVLKFVNTTNQNLSVEWDLEAFYNDICTTCKKDKEYHFSTSLNAGETKIGNYDKRDKERGLLIFAKFTNMENRSELTKFNLANLRINIL